MTTRTRCFAVLLAVSITLLLPALLQASGERANIAGLSMGRTYTAWGRGLEAVGTNPANLVLPHRGKGVSYTLTGVDSTGPDSNGVVRYHKTYMSERETPPYVTLSLPSVGFSIGSDFINYDIYNKYFTGVDSSGSRVSKFLNTDDKNAILELFPSGIAETHADFDIRAFGMTIHSGLGEFALTITDRISFELDVPKDYASFFLFGLDSLGSRYSIDGTSIGASYLRDYAFSYARKIPQMPWFDDFAAGITLKVVHGYGVFVTDSYSGSFGNNVLPEGGYSLTGNVSSRSLHAATSNYYKTDSLDFSPFPAAAGHGFGIDIGFSGEIAKGIRTGLSITDIGSVNWTENAVENTANASFSMTNPTSAEQSDSLKDAFKGTENPISDFSTGLPTTLRVGAMFQVDEVSFLSFLPGEMILTLDYEQGLRKSPGISTRPRVALGTEWRPLSWIPLRTGISVGGADRFNWAAGFGFDLDVFVFNLGTENLDVLFSPKAFKQASFGMGMIIRI